MMPRAGLSVSLSHDATHTNLLRRAAVLPALPAAFALEPVFILQPIGHCTGYGRTPRPTVDAQRLS